MFKNILVTRALSLTLVGALSLTSPSMELLTESYFDVIEEKVLESSDEVKETVNDSETNNQDNPENEIQLYTEETVFTAKQQNHVGYLTWGVDSGKTANIYVVDENMNQVDGNSIEGTIETTLIDQAVGKNFDELATLLSVHGYTYSYAKVKDGNEINNLVYDSQGYGWCTSTDEGITPLFGQVDERDELSIYLVYSKLSGVLYAEGKYCNAYTKESYSYKVYSEQDRKKTNSVRVVYFVGGMQSWSKKKVLAPQANNEQGAYVYNCDEINLVLEPIGDNFVSEVRYGYHTDPIAPNADGTYTINIDKNKNNSQDQTLYVVLNYTELTGVNMFDYDMKTMNQATRKLAEKAGTGNYLLFTENKKDEYGNTPGKLWNLCDTCDGGTGLTDAIAYQGLVQDNLGSDGLPVFNYVVSDLFDTTKTDNKIAVRTNVSIPFVYENGYYTFDSKEYNYKYNLAQNKITKSDYSSTDSNKDFWAFLGTETGSNTKFHFSMVVPFNFSIGENGKTASGENTVFNFSGDDDVWVFIDGKLALDIGGIHQRVSGSIDFANAESTVTYARMSDGNKYTDRYNTHYGVKKTSLYKLLGYSTKEEYYEAFTNKTHTMKVFYVERGAGNANCKISYNFTPLNTSESANVEFTKVESLNGNITPLAGSTFALYSAEDSGFTNPIQMNTSLVDGSVSFSGINPGTYYIKEISTVENYVLPQNALWKLFVASDLSYTITAVNYEAKTLSLKEDETKVSDYTTTVSMILNLPEAESTLYVDKSATTSNWDERIYQIDLSASYVEKRATSNTENIDIVLILDNSSYMSAVVSQDSNGNEITASDMMISSAVDFVNSLTSDSNVAVVAFGGKNDCDVKCNLTKLDTDEKREFVIEKLKDCTPTQNMGRYPAKAVEWAANILKQDGSVNSKLAIYFSNGDNQEDNKYSLINGAKALRESASAGVYSLGVGTSLNDLYYLATNGTKDITDANGLPVIREECPYVKRSENLSDINRIFEDAMTEIVGYTGGTSIGNAWDYIDTRFYVVDEAGNALTTGSIVTPGGGRLCEDSDGNQYVKWENANFGSLSKKWSDIVYVKAKDDFVGGNYIATNQLSSRVELEKHKAAFPVPSVNVKLLEIATDSIEKTVFLNEELKPFDYLESLVTTNEDDLFAEFIHLLEYNDLETLVAKGTVTPKRYTYNNEEMGSVTYSFVKETEKKAKETGDDVYCYTLKLEYTADTVAKRKDSVTYVNKDPLQDEVVSTDFERLHYINVIAAELDFTKIAKKSSPEAKTIKLDNATYKLESKDGFEQTLTSCTVGDQKGQLYFGELGLGEYTLKEISSPTGFGINKDVYNITISKTEDKYKVEVKNGDVVMLTDFITAEDDHKDSFDDLKSLWNMDHTVVYISGDEELFLEDEILYELPMTGGKGIYFNIIGGILLMLLATLLLYRNKNYLRIKRR